MNKNQSHMSLGVRHPGDIVRIGDLVVRRHGTYVVVGGAHEEVAGVFFSSGCGFYFWDAGPRWESVGIDGSILVGDRVFR